MNSDQTIFRTLECINFLVWETHYRYIEQHKTLYLGRDNTSDCWHHKCRCRIFFNVGNSWQTKISKFKNWISMTILAQHDVGRFDVTMSNRGFQAVEMCYRASNLKNQCCKCWQRVGWMLYSDLTLHSQWSQEILPWTCSSFERRYSFFFRKLNSITFLIILYEIPSRSV